MLWRLTNRRIIIITIIIIIIHWGLLGIWVKYNVFVPFFIYLYFFSETRVQVRPFDGFLRMIAH